MTFGSNYEAAKIGFEKETKLKASENMALFLQYYSAKMNDYTMQLTAQVLEELKRRPFK